ncbi:glycoside hydrolase family protein [Paracoccus alkanivorans]|uniref:Glycoside hydrolase family 104 protein n=1 Tax=Paracoccus alkanivorans TaxID=2116655 RepID=A0A3M0M7I6_9RHOB|nr:glycoside hydrolase family protein [Paracoccus alkanivorans]RMC33758.1 hypothetical protein C9E81_15770 [Paracoccus alkanivorans]
MTFTLYHARPVLDLIGKYEGIGSYDTIYGGISKDLRPAKLTSMTVAQVVRMQETWRAKGMKSTAAGLYQILYKTLLATIQQMNFDTSRKFDAATQDSMAYHLLTGRGFQRFLDGKIDADDMAVALSKEWASLPVPHDMQGANRWLRAGQSYYAGDGLNKAHASIREVEVALAVAKERYRSGAQPSDPVSPPVSDQDPIKKPAESPSPGMLGALLVAAAFCAIVLVKG